MSYYEYFQSNESSIDSAYNSIESDLNSYDLPFCEASDGKTDSSETANTPNAQKSSTIQNLWDFLGLSNATKEEKGCLFDCSIQGSNCLENCDTSNSPKCNYNCLNKGLMCTKKCMLPPPPKCKQKPILQTTSVVKPTIKPPSENKHFFSNYAPVNSDFWPSNSQVGWDVDKIDTYTTNNTIEVLLDEYHPVDSPSPQLLF